MEKHIIQFFKFLEDKEGKSVPLRLKLLDPQTWGKPTKEDLNVKGDLDLSGTNIKELPQGLKVGEDLNLYGCKSLKKLPQGLKVDGVLNLYHCTSLKELPEGLEVDYGLYLSYCTSLKELPQGLKVDGDLDLRYTPIAEKYTKEEIRKMIEDGGGYIKGPILM
jgi:hypothetical protein